MKVAGNPVSITPDALNLADTAAVPLPIGATASQLLNAQDITVDVLGVRSTKDTVVSPALRIRYPSQLPDGSSAVVTMLIGNSIASLTSITGGPVVAGVPGAVTAKGSATPTTDTAGSEPGLLPGIADPAAGVVRTDAGIVVSSDPAATVVRIPPQLSIDISSFYLVCALALAVVFAMSQVIRLVGVRSR
jgi:hypothetical protein